MERRWKRDGKEMCLMHNELIETALLGSALERDELEQVVAITAILPGKDHAGTVDKKRTAKVVRVVM